MSNSTSNSQSAPGGVKRYRPAPAKTFQCRGFGDCRMVFSRSEHLARHVRKHTGERPFSCHCSKQFSRLDNLRQHAQTVHSDKADENERMMRELTSLHASIAGKTKGVRGTKKEEFGEIPTFVARPGTTAGYEAHSSTASSPEEEDGSGRSFRETDSPPNHSQSFREQPQQSFREHPHQSFREHANSQSFRSDSTSTQQSFRPHTHSNNQQSTQSFRDRESFRPISSTSATQSFRPVSNHGVSLPPLSSLVPSSAIRPTTAPAQHLASQYASSYASSWSVVGSGYASARDRDDDSPFSFNPPESHQAYAIPANPSYPRPPSSYSYSYQNRVPTAGGTAPSGRKRTFSGLDGPEPFAQHAEYGSTNRPQSGIRPGSSGLYGDAGSRPQSRRLSVLELCHPDPEPSSPSTTSPTDGLVVSPPHAAANHTSANVSPTSQSASASPIDAAATSSRDVQSANGTAAFEKTFSGSLRREWDNRPVTSGGITRGAEGLSLSESDERERERLPSRGGGLPSAFERTPPPAGDRIFGFGSTVGDASSPDADVAEDLSGSESDASGSETGSRRMVGVIPSTTTYYVPTPTRRSPLSTTSSASSPVYERERESPSQQQHGYDRVYERHSQSRSPLSSGSGGYSPRSPLHAAHSPVFGVGVGVSDGHGMLST